MEKILNSKGIQLIENYTEEGFSPCYAYNQDMLGKNVLIEFYGVETDEDNPENSEVETVVFVHAIQNDISYTLTMFYELGVTETAPMQIFRIITDLVDYIGLCNDEFIIDNLVAIAKGVTSSLEMESEIAQAEVYDMIDAKFQYVRDRMN